MVRQCVARLLVMLFALRAIALGAEDIDVFSLSSDALRDAPKVLLVVDDAAIGEAAFAGVKLALLEVIDGLPTAPDGEARFHVGVVLSSALDATGDDVESGRILAAMQPMDARGKAMLGVLIDALDGGRLSSQQGRAGLAMAAAHAHLRGADAHREAPAQGGCAQTHVILVGSGDAHDGEADTRLAAELLQALGGDLTAIPLSPPEAGGSVADEWARFMRQDSAELLIHALDVGTVGDGWEPGRGALLRSVASVGGGSHVAVRTGAAADIGIALNTLIGNVLAADSVFAPVSLPASTDTRGVFLNQVFIGMFRPDASALPRWRGNLKQYRFEDTAEGIALVDADGANALDPTTGTIAACARSYWSPARIDDYWAHQPQGGCAAVTASRASNFPDGPLVEKGAQAFMLRQSTARIVKTCAPDFAACTALTDFDVLNGAISKERLGDATMSDGARMRMIDWLRGLDVGEYPADERVNGVTAAEVRASVHGDVLHSQPLAINYGTDTDPQVVVFYAANDGMLRAINGNRHADIGAPLTRETHAPGAEMWSFVAPEFWSSITRLYTNAVRIDLPGLPPGPALPKPYALDGPISAYQGAIDGVRKVFLYVGMRRGGRALYAFDVTVPDVPVLKWKRGCPARDSDAGCTSDVVHGDWRGIGETWSEAVAVTLEGRSRPVLLMGGGYDSCEDFDGGTGGATHDCASTRGNRIYVIDADSGVLLREFETLRAVAAAPVPVGGLDEGAALQFVYAADTGGNLYRISGASPEQAIAETAPAQWTITRIAALGCDTVAACRQQRKFLFPPDVVRDGQGFWLMIGSGDREKPHESHAAALQVQNQFFALRDQPLQPHWLADEAVADRCGAALLCMASLSELEAQAPGVPPGLQGGKGWRLPLAATEAVVTSALTVSNRLVFSTFRPAPRDRACPSPLGETKVYSLRYDSGVAFVAGEQRSQLLATGGLPPSPRAGRVRLDDGRIVPFLVGASARSALEAVDPVPSEGALRPRIRVYWHVRK